MGEITDGEATGTPDEPVHAGMRTVPAGKPVIVRMRQKLPAAGTATLTPLLVPAAGHTVWIVQPDARAAAFFGATAFADKVVGGIVQTSRGWAVTAYRDRADLFRPGGVSYTLPDAVNRAHAARCLVQWWWWVNRLVKGGEDPRHVDPERVPEAMRRQLFR